MSKFVAKPEVIEAVHWSNGRFKEMPKWLSDAINEKTVNKVIRVGDNIHVFTVTGVQIAEPGDWILCNEKGELSVCDPRTFAVLYNYHPSEIPG